MALKKPIVYKTIPLDAYFRVALPQISDDKQCMSFGVWVYASQGASADSANLLPDACRHLEGVPYSLAGANIFEQAYAHLKTLPEMEGAVDVFDPAEPEVQLLDEPAAVVREDEPVEARNVFQP